MKYDDRPTQLHARQARYYESQFLSMFWHQPGPTWDAGSRAKLSDADFVYGEHVWLLRVLWLWFQSWDKKGFWNVPNMPAEGIYKLNAESGGIFPIEYANCDTLWELLMCADFLLHGADEIAQAIKDLSRRRKLAREWISKAHEIIGAPVLPGN